MTDRLSLWGDTINRRLLRMEFGDVPRRSASNDDTFRAKNESTEYDAIDVTVTLDGTGSEQFYLSVDDGITFTASASLGDLVASAISRPITLRRVTSSSDALGDQQCTLQVTAGSWAPAHQT